MRARWKVVLQLVFGVALIAAGGYLMAEASDLVPFAIHDPIAMGLGAIITWRGWDVTEKAWDRL
jgi:hypothetical protein